MLKVENDIMIFRFVLVFAALISLAGPIEAQNTLVGVLEELPGAYAGEPKFRAVRVVFEKHGNDWAAFPSNCPDQACLKTISSQYPTEVAWTVTFNGHSLGRISGRTPDGFKFYSYMGLQEITTKRSIPSVRKRLATGSTQMALFRPLVTNSRPYYKDPESWKPSLLSSTLVTILRQEFRHRYPRVCRASVQDETKLEPFSYVDQDIKVITAYSSKTNWSVVRLHLDGAIDCNDLEAGFEIDDPWFEADPDNRVHYLDQGIWLVDAGDYANTGKSELIFAIDRENRGGYEMFYDDMKKRAVFEFFYH